MASLGYYFLCFHFRIVGLMVNPYTMTVNHGNKKQPDEPSGIKYSRRGLLCGTCLHHYIVPKPKHSIINKTTPGAHCLSNIGPIPQASITMHTHACLMFPRIFSSTSMIPKKSMGMRLLLFLKDGQEGEYSVAQLKELRSTPLKCWDVLLLFLSLTLQSSSWSNRVHVWFITRCRNCSK